MGALAEVEVAAEDEGVAAGRVEFRFDEAETG
jgi:hypothetical protein